MLFFRNCTNAFIVQAFDFITVIQAKRNPTIRSYKFACFSRKKIGQRLQERKKINVLHQSFIEHCCSAQIMSYR